MKLSQMASTAPVYLQVRLELTVEQLFKLASKCPFLRENPRKSWTLTEAKEAARAAIIRLAVEQGVDSK